MGLGDLAGSATVPDVDYSQDQDFGIVSITQNSSAGDLYSMIVDQQQVQTVRLDDLNLPRLDFYKLDVEGFEIPALRGAHATIRQHRPFMWIEYWKAGLDEIKAELADIHGYQCVVMDPLNVLFAPQEKLRGYGLEFKQG